MPRRGMVRSKGLEIVERRKENMFQCWSKCDQERVFVHLFKIYTEIKLHYRDRDGMTSESRLRELFTEIFKLSIVE